MKQTKAWLTERLPIALMRGTTCASSATSLPPALATRVLLRVRQKRAESELRPRTAAQELLSASSRAVRTACPGAHASSARAARRTERGTTPGRTPAHELLPPQPGLGGLRAATNARRPSAGRRGPRRRSRRNAHARPPSQPASLDLTLHSDQTSGSRRVSRASEIQSPASGGSEVDAPRRREAAPEGRATS